MKTKMAKTNDNKKKKEILSNKLSLNSEYIRVNAYYIWENKGKPYNTALEDWIEAEHKLIK